jgi:hypothetical protein
VSDLGPLAKRNLDKALQIIESNTRQATADALSSRLRPITGGGTGIAPSAVPAAALSGVSVTLHPPYLAASAAATNLAATTFSAVDDPAYRWRGDLRGRTHLRIMGRIGGSLVAATKLRVQYHVGGDPAVVTGDGGWTTLATTAGSHTLATLFYTAELSVPSGAQINNVLLRVGLYDGDGAADPTISACILSLYP